MTQRLYYKDSYLTKAQARVIASSDDGRRVTLDQTVFYPTSGGQPHDLGTLNQIPILDVVDEGDTVSHVLQSPLNATDVLAEIDWGRRYDHMQQHTGQHLLSSVFADLFGISTLSFHMGEESSSIELETKDLTQLQIQQALLRATHLARVNPQVTILFEDAASVQGLRKPSERTGRLRIIEIPGVDRSACGGTHVAALAEVLPLQIRELEKVRGNQRISFVCGDRALRRAQSDFLMLSSIAKILATPLDNLELQLTSMRHRLVESEKQKLRLEAEAATRAGLNLYANTQPSSDGTRRFVSAESVIDENARMRAKAFSSQPRAICLMHSPDGFLLACSADSGVNAGAVVKQSLLKFGARGGGSPTLAQGSLSDAAILLHLQTAIGG